MFETWSSGQASVTWLCSTGFLNPKHEIKNSKQYPMFQIQMFKTSAMAKVASNRFVFHRML
jgi:hypothetical protein